MDRPSYPGLVPIRLSVVDRGSGCVAWLASGPGTKSLFDRPRLGIQFVCDPRTAPGSIPICAFLSLFRTKRSRHHCDGADVVCVERERTGGGWKSGPLMYTVGVGKDQSYRTYNGSRLRFDSQVIWNGAGADIRSPWNQI